MPHTAAEGPGDDLCGVGVPTVPAAAKTTVPAAARSPQHALQTARRPPQLSCRSATSLYTPGSARPPVVSCASRHTRCCTRCPVECVRDQARSPKRARQTSSAGASQFMHAPQAQQRVGGHPATGCTETPRDACSALPALCPDKINTPLHLDLRVLRTQRPGAHLRLAQQLAALTSPKLL